MPNSVAFSPTRCAATATLVAWRAHCETTASVTVTAPTPPMSESAAKVAATSARVANSVEIQWARLPHE